MLCTVPSRCDGGLEQSGSWEAQEFVHWDTAADVVAEWVTFNPDISRKPTI